MIKNGVSTGDIDRLRRELDMLRSGERSEAHSASLVQSMDKLHSILEKLVSLFEQAEREVYDEYTQGVHDEITAIKQVQADVIELKRQNEKIAGGIVALADIIKERVGVHGPRPAPQQQTLPVRPALPSENLVVATPVQPPAPETAVPVAPPIPQLATSRPQEPTFLRQNVSSLYMLPPAPLPSTPPVAPQPVVAVPRPPAAAQQLPALPPLPSMPPLQPKPDIAWQNQPATIAQSPSLPRELPPPLPSAAPQERRRSLLEKFSFK